MLKFVWELGYVGYHYLHGPTLPYTVVGDTSAQTLSNGSLPECPLGVATLMEGLPDVLFLSMMIVTWSLSGSSPDVSLMRNGRATHNVMVVSK